jgi:hypothetical protein
MKLTESGFEPEPWAWWRTIDMSTGGCGPCMGMGDDCVINTIVVPEMRTHHHY